MKFPIGTKVKITNKSVIDYYDCDSGVTAEKYEDADDGVYVHLPGGRKVPIHESHLEEAKIENWAARMKALTNAGSR